MRGRAPRCRCLWAASGALMAAAALACALAWSAIFDAALATKMTLYPNSLAYRKWVEPGVPIYLDMFMFNWTNADRFPDEKPNVEELGPYRFREVRRHVNVTFHPHNSSVGYRTLKTWYFEESSNGSLSDVITTLNVIAASAIFRSRHWGYLQQKGLSMGLAMFGQQVSVTRSVGELLFDGYEDPLLDLAKSLPASTTGGAPPVDKFGWFYGRNNSYETDGYVEVTTGAERGTLPGQVLKWNMRDRLPYYDGKCGELTGTAGEFMPRDLDESSTLRMFVPDLCRSLAMHYVDSGEADGLSYHKYAVGERSFDNSSLTSENTCYCDGACRWSGVMNVSACRFGSPSFISLPHFLLADEALRGAVDGLTPDPDKHSFYFDVEPKLGVPLDVAARFQINVFIEPSHHVVLYEHVPTMLFPILWMQQAVSMGDKDASEIRTVRTLADWGGVVCAISSLIFTIIAVITACCCRRRKYHRDPMADRREELKLNSKG